MTILAGAGTNAPIKTGGSLIAPTVEKFIDLQYSVADSVRQRGSWLMHDSTAGSIRKLRDGAGGTIGAFLWEPSLTAGLQSGQPDRFLDAHEALFALRHDRGGHLRDEAAVREALAGVGVDVDAVFAEIATGKPLQTVREEHEGAADEHGTWGVPTFAVGPEAAFIRFMHRPQGDGAVATRTIERVLDLLEWPELNEFKHPRLSR